MILTSTDFWATYHSFRINQQQVLLGVALHSRQDVLPLGSLTFPHEEIAIL